MKPVIAHQNDGCVIVGKLQQRAEHRVMVPVGIGNYVLIRVELRLGYPGQPRRVITHEGVAEMVDAAVIEGRKIPRLSAQQLGGDGMDRHRFRDDFSQGVQPLVGSLVHLLVIRHEQTDEIAIQLHRIDAQLAQGGSQGWRLNRAGGQRGQFARPAHGLLEMIRNHDAVQRFGGMRWPPAHDEGAMAGLVENVPERLGVAREDRHGPHRRAVRQRLGETVDAMLVGPFAGGDGGPEHRAEGGINRGEVAINAASHESSQVRHLAGIEQRLNNLPVSRIPSNQENAVQST